MTQFSPVKQNGEQKREQIEAPRVLWNTGNNSNFSHNHFFSCHTNLNFPPEIRSSITPRQHSNTARVSNSIPQNSTNSNHKRFKRSFRIAKPILTLHFTKGETDTARFDLCSVIDCRGRQKAYVWSEKYICEVYHTAEWCSYWNYVITNTGPDEWGYNPPAKEGKTSLKHRLNV